MTNSSIKKLLSVDRNAMRDLHTVIGFDFNKPFTVWEISGRFTVKQIEKEAEKRGYNNAVISVCVRDRFGWNKDFSLATVRGGVVTIDYKTPYYGNGRGLDTFYAKCSFEDMRKSESAEAVIFAQRRDDIKKPEEKKVDFSERFKVERVNYCTDGHGARWISKLELKQTTNNGKRVEYGGPWYIDNEKSRPQDVREVIDGSGYLLKERRAEWRRKAAKLRADREKEAYNATNNEKQLEELRSMIKNRKSVIVSMLQAAETCAQLREVEKAIAYWKGLAGIVSDFERFERNTAEKKYRSISESNSAFNAIKAALVEA